MLYRLPSGDDQSGESGASVGAIAASAVVLTCVAFALVLCILWLFVPDAEPVHGSVVTAVPAAADINSAASQRPSPDIDGGLIVAPFTAAAFGHVPRLASDAALTPAPDPALIQTTNHGGLPIIADGRLPRHVYARPHDAADSRKRIAVIVAGTGLSRVASEAAIQRLPAAVTLAIDAYADRPDDWARAARRAGHELLVTVPLQEPGPSLHDHGPRALRAAASADENGRRLETVLGASAGYVGVLVQGAAALEADRNAFEPLLAAGRSRGLLLVDATGDKELLLADRARRLGTAAVSVDIVLEPAGADVIDRQLAELKTITDARSNGVVLAYANPATLERLRAWISALDDRRFVLAPVSAVADGKEP